MDYETNTSTSTINTTTTNTAEINNNIIEPNKQPDTIKLIEKPVSTVSDEGNPRKITIEKINKRRVFIENIHYDVHENLISRFFGKYGKIKRAKIIRDSQNNSKGFGYIEFFNENDATQMLINANPDKLVLKDRTMIIQKFISKQKKKHSVKKTAKDNTETETEPVDTFEQTDELNINDLPLDIFSNIFSRLSLRELCLAEKVCKKWYNIAKVVWSSKNKLVLNKENIFDKYVENGAAFGFKTTPNFDAKCLKQILTKIKGNLKQLDLSAVSHSLGKLCLSFVTELCPNITHLNLSRLSISNQSFKFLRNLTKLKSLNMSYCSQISDNSLIRILQNCKELESLQMIFCHMITGEFLRDIRSQGHNLKSLNIDQCENITDKNLIKFFDSNTELIKLSMTRNSKAYATETILFLIKNLTNLESLNLTDYGLASLTTDDFEKINFAALTNLQHFDISTSIGNNSLIKKLLSKSKSLKSLNLGYCTKLDDDVFSSLVISCPLEELNLSFSRITDISLQSLIQLKNSLKSLKIKGCSSLTNDGIIQTITELDRLNYLDVGSISNVNNALLEKALHMEKRKITINCNDTSVSTIEFEYKYPKTVKSLIDVNLYNFRYKNLIFIASLTKKLHSQKFPWDNVYVMGSSYSSSESLFDFDEIDEDQMPVDDLDFLEENQEMLNELDEGEDEDEDEDEEEEEEWQ